MTSRLFTSGFRGLAHHEPHVPNTSTISPRKMPPLRWLPFRLVDYYLLLLLLRRPRQQQHLISAAATPNACSQLLQYRLLKNLQVRMDLSSEWSRRL